MSKRRNLPLITTKLHAFYKEHRRLPTYSEIANLCGYASKRSSFLLVGALIKAGIVSKDKSGHLIPKKLLPPLPIYGTIKAGWPSPAEEELVDTLSLDEYVVRNPQASFLLRVSGDSMLDAGIHAGDLVIIERGRRPKSGDIVLAQIDQEWTLKYFEKQGEKVALVPGNKKYPTIYPEEELVVTGVVRAVIRKYH